MISAGLDLKFLKENYRGSIVVNSRGKSIASCSAHRVLISICFNNLIFKCFARLLPRCCDLCQVDEIYSPRTSISSSVRFSISGDYDGASFSKGSPERSPEEPLKGSPEETVGKYPPVFPSKSPEESPERSPEKNSGEFQKESSKGSSVEVVKGSPQIPSEISLERSTKEASEIPGNKSSEGKWRGWFELFSGMSSKGMVRYAIVRGLGAYKTTRVAISSRKERRRRFRSFVGTNDRRPCGLLSCPL